MRTMPSSTVALSSGAFVTTWVLPALAPTEPVSRTGIGSSYWSSPFAISRDSSERRSTGTVMRDASGAAAAAAASAGDWSCWPITMPAAADATLAPTTNRARFRRR